MSVESYHSTQTTASTMSRQPYTKKGQKIIKMSGGKKIALMGISDAIEDWADQW